jgi:hypothetical protein
LGLPVLAPVLLCVSPVSLCNISATIGKSECQIIDQQDDSQALTRNNLTNFMVKPEEGMAADFYRAKMLFDDAANASGVAVEKIERVDTLLLSVKARA